jgi:hypothetical protein
MESRTNVAIAASSQFYKDSLRGSPPALLRAAARREFHLRERVVFGQDAIDAGPQGQSRDGS